MSICRSHLHSISAVFLFPLEAPLLPTGNLRGLDTAGPTPCSDSRGDYLMPGWPVTGFHFPQPSDCLWIPPNPVRWTLRCMLERWEGISAVGMAVSRADDSLEMLHIVEGPTWEWNLHCRKGTGGRGSWWSCPRPWMQPTWLQTSLGFSVSPSNKPLCLSCGFCHWQVKGIWLRQIPKAGI